MRRVAVFAVVAALVLCVSACAAPQFITVKTTIPPEKDIPLHIKNVAVLSFSGHPGGSEVVSVKLEQELLNNQHYKLIERSEIAAIISEKNFQQTDLVENEAFLEEMKIKQVHALITGSVATFNAVTERGVDERQVQYRVSGPVFDSNFNLVRPAVYGYRTIREPWMARHGNVNATFKMVAVGTGQILASVSKGGGYSTGKVKQGMPAGESVVLERAALDAVVKFIKDVSVWTEVAKLKLKKGKNTKMGNTFAANGLFEKAEEQFRVAGELPGNYAAIYNLGLALEAQCRYAEAGQEFDRALPMRPADKEIMAAINRIKVKKVFEERIKKLRGMQ